MTHHDTQHDTKRIEPHEQEGQGMGRTTGARSEQSEQAEQERRTIDRQDTSGDRVWRAANSADDVMDDKIEWQGSRFSKGGSAGTADR